MQSGTMLMQMSVCLESGVIGARHGFVRLFQRQTGNELPVDVIRARYVNGRSLERNVITVGDMCQMGVCSLSETTTGTSQVFRMQALDPPSALLNRRVYILSFFLVADVSEAPHPYSEPVLDNICGAGTLLFDAEFDSMFHGVQSDGCGYSPMTKTLTYFGTVHEMYTIAGTATFRWVKRVGGSISFKGVKDPDFLNRIIYAICPGESWDRTLADGALYVHMAVVTMRLGRNTWAYSGCLLERYMCTALPQGLYCKNCAFYYPLIPHEEGLVILVNDTRGAL